jgi:flagellar biosynthetic protein FliQ
VSPVSPDVVVALARETLWVALAVAGPLLGAGLLAGLLVSLVQAVTQIQESTLSFLPKALAVGLVLALLGHWMLAQLVGYAVGLFQRLATLGALR